MLFRLDLEGCLAGAVGERGLDDATFARYLDESRNGLARLALWRENGTLPILNLSNEVDDLGALRPVADKLKSYKTLVVLGAGGSSLGGQTLLALGQRSGTTVRFVDNVDPHSFSQLLGSLDASKTGFLAISKSGRSAGTLMSLLLVLDWLRKQRSEAAFAGQVVIVSEPGDTPLNRLAERFSMTHVLHDAKIGGRFAVLSAVGCLPAMVADLDVEAVRAGARSVVEATLNARDAEHAQAARGAAAMIGLERERHMQVSVVMPYLDRLARFALWYKQLWAESVGKDGKGMVPLRAMGTVDQHSQFQLYLDGPNNKLFTLIVVNCADQGARVPDDLAEDSELGYLRGKTIGDLMEAEHDAAQAALVEKGRPVRIIRLARLDEEVMGGLLMHCMLETILAALLLGVNPFDQPAVERLRELSRVQLAGMD